MQLSKPHITFFRQKLIAWQKKHGRHDLPWQRTRDPYRIWLSEIMLQQTQVATVIDYYQRFLKRFPSLSALATAPQDDVLALWSGLGYYRRATHLHRAAKMLIANFEGVWPEDAETLTQLPGIGRSTAAAIAAFAFQQSAAICDGNVQRVFARFFGIDSVKGSGEFQKTSWALAESLVPKKEVDTYTQGLMDLGATLCTRSKPRCSDCPLKRHCVAHTEHTGKEANFPVRGAKKTVRTLRYAVLLLHSKKRVYLEKRQPGDIWADLWCLPMFLSLSDLKKEALDFGATSVKKGTLLEHKLTHRQLMLVPYRGMLVEPRKKRARGKWVSASDLPTLGLPKPIRDILLEVL